MNSQTNTEKTVPETHHEADDAETCPLSEQLVGETPITKTVKNKITNHNPMA